MSIAQYFELPIICCILCGGSNEGKKKTERIIIFKNCCNSFNFVLYNMALQHLLAHLKIDEILNQ
jgi:hypothetical protein